MAVSIEDIKTLRDRTGVSMSACKSALEEAGGDIDEAIALLRKKGEAKAASRAERSTAEGTIVIEQVGDKAAILELLSETDFVARSDDFKAVAADLAKKLLNGELEVGVKEFPAQSDVALKLGENIQLGQTALVGGSVIGSYIHSNGKIGVVVVLDGGSDDLAKDIAMHAAATNPSVIKPEEVSEDLVVKEKEIWKEQLAKEGKPEEMIEKIMFGKEKKFRDEAALVKQAFVKNPEQTIEQLLDGVNVVSVTRFAI